MTSDELGTEGAPFPLESYADWCLDRIATALEVIASVASLGVLARQQPAAEPGTPLPEEFPGREALEEAGVIYLEGLPRKGPELERLGLDGLTVGRVLTWLKVNG